MQTTRAASVSVWALWIGIILLSAGSGTYIINRWRHVSDRCDACTTLCGAMPATAVAPTPFLPMLQSTLPAGAPAPQLQLQALDGGEPLDLSYNRDGRPVVLVFGSFTCDAFLGRLAAIEKAYQRNKDRAAFAFVGIAEAGHPIEGFEFLLQDVEEIPGVAFFPFERKRVPAANAQEKNTRLERLQKAYRMSGLTLPAYVDLPGQDALKAYSAFPARVVVVNARGAIARDLGNILGSSWDWQAVEELLTQSDLH